MINKKLSLLALAVLTLCLLGLAFGQFASAGAVAQAANETQLVLASAGPSEKQTIPATRLAQPIAAAATGLVCVLFGIIAVAPLLLGDPAQSLQEANRAEP